MKYYHLYADGRTVREISYVEYRKLAYRVDRNFTVLALADSWFSITQRGRSTYCQLRQLKQVLGDSP